MNKQTFLYFFSETGAIGRLLVASLFTAIPPAIFLVLNRIGFSVLSQHWWGALLLISSLPAALFWILVFGYYQRYGALVLEDLETPLPEWRGFSDLLRRGIRVAALILVCFSPTWLFLALGSYFGLRIPGGIELSYLAYSFFAVFSFLAAFFLALLLLLIFPVCFFRFVESDELIWTVLPAEVLEDTSGMGSGYWQMFLFSGAFFFLGMTVAVYMASILSVVIGAPLPGEIFALSAFSVLFNYFALLMIKRHGVLYAELPYKY